MAFVDRSGHETLLPHESADYLHPRLSPDGGRLAVTIRNAQGVEVWILDLDRPTRTRLTFSDLDDSRPVWTPDGRRLAFVSQASNVGDLYWKLSDGTGNAELLLESASLKWPFDFSHDGTTLLYSDVASSENRNIWTMTLDEEPTPFVATTFDEVNPRFSPDGRWVAYVSNESGRDEIYARPYPGPGGAVVLSTDGGTEPVWSQTGGELFFRSGDKMMAIPIRQKPAFDFGDPELLFEGSFRRANNSWSYDVTSDGQRFVMVPLASEADTAQIHVVLNWIQELDQLLRQ